MNPPPARPLLLEQDPSAAEQTGWKRNQELIDALPYIDGLADDMRKKVGDLIEEEMRNSSKRPIDYLKELPPVPPLKFEGHPLLAAEFARVRDQVPMPPIDTIRHQLNPPPASRKNEYPAWKAALDNAQSQLEHQRLRILNLELMLKYAPSVWRAQNQQNEAACKQLEAELAELKASTEQINKERKLQQQAVGGELRRLEAEYLGLVQKNLDIESACSQMEWEVERMRSALEARQAPPPQENGGQPDAAGPAANGVAQPEGGAEPGPSSSAQPEQAAAAAAAAAVGGAAGAAQVDGEDPGQSAEVGPPRPADGTEPEGPSGEEGAQQMQED